MQPKPSLIYWKLRSGVVIPRIINNPSLEEIACQYDLHTKSSNHLQFAKTIPYGSTDWSLDPDGPWQPVATLPLEWRIEP